MERDRTFATLIAVYLDACRAEGKSPKTVIAYIAYAESLRIFTRHATALGLPEQVDEVTATDVYRFLGAVRATASVTRPSIAATGR